MAMLKFLIITVICIIASFNIVAQTPAPTVPNFIFYNLDKTPFTNGNLAVGKEILFIFFDVTCDHCQHAIRALNSRIGEFKETAIYLITLNDKVIVSSFLNRYGKNLPKAKNVTILQDMNNQFITQFGPRKYPSVFLYSVDKKLILYDDEDQTLENFFKLMNALKK